MQQCIYVYLLTRLERDWQPYILIQIRAGQISGGRGCQTFSSSLFPCSADHERDWPPCKVVFWGVGNHTCAECEKQYFSLNKQQPIKTPKFWASSNTSGTDFNRNVPIKIPKFNRHVPIKILKFNRNGYFPHRWGILLFTPPPGSRARRLGWSQYMHECVGVSQGYHGVVGGLGLGLGLAMGWLVGSWRWYLPHRCGDPAVPVAAPRQDRLGCTIDTMIALRRANTLMHVP